MRRIVKFNLSASLALGLMLISCSKEKADSKYSAYYADLMSLSVLRDVPHMGPKRTAVQETQMEIVGPVLYVLDPYEGVHTYKNSNHSKYNFLISPGATKLTPNSGGIYVDRAVDIANFGSRGNQTIAYRGYSANPLQELQPPDGKEIPPIFKRENRIKDTEIIKWEK